MLDLGLDRIDGRGDYLIRQIESSQFRCHNAALCMVAFRALTCFSVDQQRPRCRPPDAPVGDDE